MSDHVARYIALMDRFIAWAETRPDVRHAFIVGSRARSAQAADEWSDLDAVMFADDPEVLLQDEKWMSELGTWEISFREPTAIGIWEERRVLFADGCDADFSILPATLLDDLESMGPESELYRQAGNVVARGYRVLVDKDGRLGPLLDMMASAAKLIPEHPTQAMFDQILSDFWYHCPWTARKLARGELAVAHECLEGNQRGLLVRLLHWRAARDGHTWHGTRFLEHAMPPTIREQYARTFAHHDTEDIARALGEMMDLVHILGREIGEAYGLEVNPVPEDAARRWTSKVLET